MPAAECMTLSIQACKGLKQPSSLLLAAFTIASTFSLVISPCHRCIPSCLISTIPFSSLCAASSLSCASIRSCEGLSGCRTFINERIRRCLSGKVSGLVHPVSISESMMLIALSMFFSLSIIYPFFMNRSPTKPLLSVCSMRLRCR